MKRKICFITDSIFTIGGVQRVTAVIANELSKYYDVTVMTFDSHNNYDTSIYNLSSKNISFVFLQYPRLNKIHNFFCKSYSYLYKKVLPQNSLFSYLYSKSSFQYKQRKYLIDTLNNNEYNAIIAVHVFISARIGTIKDKLNCKMAIGWIHNSYDALFGFDSNYIGSVLIPYYRFGLKQLRDVIVLSNYDAAMFRKNMDLHPTVIYNPITLLPGNTITGKSKRFLAIGRFSHRHKGFDLLIKAFGLFAKKNNDWILDIVGEGPEEDSYMTLIKLLGLENRVYIHPFTSNVQYYYSNASIYILSSRWEGFGLVLVEAMSHGLSIISSDIPTSKEILGDFGLYFRNGDYRDLASVMMNAVDIDIKKNINNAMILASKFDVELIVKQWIQLFSFDDAAV